MYPSTPSGRADRTFSEMVRERDPVCVRCRRNPSSDCSHFWERGHSATRYDFRNADGLCRTCHQIWEGRTTGYVKYKKRQLGAAGYRELEKLHNTVVMREDAISKFLESI